MNINEILRGVDCECGRHHFCSIESVFIENGAVSRLSELCEGYVNVLIVADENTYGAGGERVVAALDGKKIEKVIFDGKTVLIPDERAIERVNESLGNTEIIIALGSGVIQDLCKYVSHFSRLPYIDVATAPSMDGYASDGAAMILKGMKETIKAGLPKAIICDVDILRDAPMEMIQAGYGDIIGKYSALCDWRLANIVNGEYLCEYIYSITEEMIKQTRALASGLMKRQDESIAALAEALIVVGIMMSFAGSSRPASGSEHHLSHFFEIVGIVKNEPYLAHGIDVAYSTVITSSIREKLLDTPFPGELFRLSQDEYVKKIESLYGSVSGECIALQEKVGNYAKNRVDCYLEKEREIKRLFKSVPSAWEIEEMLAQVGLNIRNFYSTYGIEKIKNAISYAKDLKDRYSVLWLYYDLFGEEK